MQRSRRTISSSHYYILLSTLINLVFLLVSAGFIDFLPMTLSASDLLIILFVLVWKGVLVGLVVWLFSKQGGRSLVLIKFIGSYLGRFYSVIVGGFLGVEVSAVLGVAEAIGFFVGALVFYFPGRWVGGKVVLFLDRQLGKVFVLPETSTPEQVE